MYKEFAIYTGKSIEIKENNFFENSAKDEEEPTVITSKPLPNVKLLREKIQENISALCFGYYEYDDLMDNVPF